MNYALLAILSLSIMVVTAHADKADVVNVQVETSADGSYRFHVTVKHDDNGWDHYADKWHIVAPDETILDTRTLYHPHVDEQPFTRSLSGVKIPSAVNVVTVQAHDSVHGFGGKVISVELPR